MSKYFFILIYIFLSVSETSFSAVTVEEIIEEIKSKYAPDKRVAIYEIEIINHNPIILRGETNLHRAKDALLARLEEEQLAFIDSIKILIPTPALVRISVCNIRSAPKHSAELATQSLMGTSLKIYKQTGSWYYVQTPEGYLGWLDRGGLHPISVEEMKHWQVSDKIVVTASHGTVTSREHSQTVSDVVAGNILLKTGVYENFVFVQLPDGRIGVLPNSLVVPYQEFLQPSTPLWPHILATARSFLGRPYLWGGTSSRAMDCSGFTKTVFYLNGFELPRDASQQIHVGLPVETDTTLRNLQPGDFLFFGRPATIHQKAKITHVGIYMGDGKMIHSSEMVRIQSLRRGDNDFAENRLRTLVGARRMLEGLGDNGVRLIREHPDY